MHFYDPDSTTVVQIFVRLNSQQTSKYSDAASRSDWVETVRNVKKNNLRSWVLGHGAFVAILRFRQYSQPM